MFWLFRRFRSIQKIMPEHWPSVVIALPMNLQADFSQFSRCQKPRSRRNVVSFQSNIRLFYDKFSITWCHRVHKYGLGDGRQIVVYVGSIYNQECIFSNNFISCFPVRANGFYTLELSQFSQVYITGILEKTTFYLIAQTLQLDTMRLISLLRTDTYHPNPLAGQITHSIS